MSSFKNLPVAGGLEDLLTRLQAAVLNEHSGTNANEVLVAKGYEGPEADGDEPLGDMEAELRMMQRRVAMVVPKIFCQDISWVMLLTVVMYLKQRLDDESDWGKKETGYKVAIACLYHAASISEDADNLAKTYRLLIDLLKALYECSRNPKILKKGTEYARRLLTASDRVNNPVYWHEIRSYAWHEAVHTIELRRRKGEGIASLEADIREVEVATDSIPDSYPTKIALMSTLGTLLERLYEHTLDVADIDMAIKQHKTATDLVPRGHADRVRALAELSIIYHRKFDYTNGNRTALESAIETAKLAVSLESTSTLDKAWSHFALSAALWARYKAMNNIRDLNEALEKAEVAASFIANTAEPIEDSVHALLAELCLTRYNKLDEIADLRRAERSASEALHLAAGLSGSELVELNRLHKLSVVLGNIYERNKDEKTLGEAIKHTLRGTEVSEKRGDGGFDQARWYNTSAWLLYSRYKAAVEKAGGESTQSAMTDLKDAVKNARKAEQTMPKTHRGYLDTVSCLANTLEFLYRETHEINHLDEAIRLDKKAENLALGDEVHKPEILRNLAVKLQLRYEHTKESCDEEHTLQALVEAFQSPSGNPLTRIACARLAMHIYINRRDVSAWLKAICIAEEALLLIPLACRRDTCREDQEHAAKKVSGLAADVASVYLRIARASGFDLLDLAIALGPPSGNARLPSGAIKPMSLEITQQLPEAHLRNRMTKALLSGDLATSCVERALQQLECWRGLIHGYLMDDRSSLLTPRGSNTALPGDTLGVGVEQTKEMEACLGDIKNLKLSPSLEDLKEQASEGPIIIVNVTDISADAIIVTQQDTMNLGLPGLSPATAPADIKRSYELWSTARSGEPGYDRKIAAARRVRREGTDLLSWLWTNCVKPVFEKLEAIGVLGRDLSADPPRVWWVGSGIAASFPFHAAGVAFDSLSRDNTLARIIPSYTPTVKALTYAREHAARSRTRDDDTKRTHSVLLVAMPTTPGHQPLPGVEAEMTAIREAFGGASGAPVFTVEALQQPTAAEALDKMPGSSIVHFACHGSSDGTSPSGSHLLLQKKAGGELAVDKLTALAVSTSLAREEQRAWIAFLSACSSAEIAAAHFADEGMHLASAFQLAGFAHVVGALWSANDDVCTDVARTFYAHLVTSASANDMTERSVAVALWHAVRKLRNQYQHSPHLWAPFVHFGA